MKQHSKELLFGLSEFYKIFGDTTRLRILDLLLNKPLCVNEISEKLGLSKDIIDNAKSLMTKNQVDIENLLKSIYDDKALID